MLFQRAAGGRPHGIEPPGVAADEDAELVAPDPVRGFVLGQGQLELL